MAAVYCESCGGRFIDFHGDGGDICPTCMAESLGVDTDGGELVDGDYEGDDEGDGAE